jgi:hypothetical protein
MEVEEIGSHWLAEYRQHDRNLRWCLAVLGYALLCRWHPRFAGLDALDALWWLNSRGTFFVALIAGGMLIDQLIKRGRAWRAWLDVTTRVKT